MTDRNRNRLASQGR